MVSLLFANPVTSAIIGSVVLLLLVGTLLVRRVKVAGPNEAFIITGRKGKAVKNPETGLVSTDMSGQKVVMGASVFVLPFVQRLHIMDLSSRRIPVGIRGALSAQGIKCDCDGVAIVKVGGNEDAIRAAAQRFLDQQEGIESFTQEVLAGALRAIVGRLTIQEIIRDRAAFASAVAEEAETSLTNQGLALDTFQLQDIQAEGEYLADLGRPEAARVQMEAAIAEAKARQAAEEERLRAEEQIAIANRVLSLKQAEILAETDAAQAKAAAAGPLAQAAQDQTVIAEQEKVAVRAALLKERELDTQVRKPADADRYRVEQQAEASKSASIAAAEAERARRAALADAVRIEGEAEATAIQARGNAEAEALTAKAQAFRNFDEAAVLDLLVRVLPDIVRAASEPIGGIDKLTVISTDGASALSKTVAENVTQGLQIGSDLMGVDLAGLLAGRARSAAAKEPAPAAPPAKAPAKTAAKAPAKPAQESS
jgi:flotillin